MISPFLAMARKKVQLAWIVNDKARKASFFKRLRNLIRKMEELCILCGVEAFVIMYPHHTVDENLYVWPNPPYARELLLKFVKMPEHDRNRKMMNQDTYLFEKIGKANQHLKRQQKSNKEFEKILLLNRIFKGNSLTNLQASELFDALSLVGDRREELEKMVSFSMRINIPPRSTTLPPLPENGEDLLSSSHMDQFLDWNFSRSILQNQGIMSATTSDIAGNFVKNLAGSSANDQMVLAYGNNNNAVANNAIEFLGGSSDFSGTQMGLADQVSFGSIQAGTQLENPSCEVSGDNHGVGGSFNGNYQTGLRFQSSEVSGGSFNGGFYQTGLAFQPSIVTGNNNGAGGSFSWRNDQLGRTTFQQSNFTENGLGGSFNGGNDKIGMRLQQSNFTMNNSGVGGRFNAGNYQLGQGWRGFQQSNFTRNSNGVGSSFNGGNDQFGQVFQQSTLIAWSNNGAGDSFNDRNNQMVQEFQQLSLIAGSNNGAECSFNGGSNQMEQEFQLSYFTWNNFNGVGSSFVNGGNDQMGQLFQLSNFTGNNNGGQGSFFNGGNDQLLSNFTRNNIGTGSHFSNCENYEMSRDFLQPFDQDFLGGNDVGLPELPSADLLEEEEEDHNAQIINQIASYPLFSP